MEIIPFLYVQNFISNKLGDDLGKVSNTAKLTMLTN